MAEDKMVWWHHQLNKHEFEQALDGEEQGSLAYCSPWGGKELDITDWTTKTFANLPDFSGYAFIIQRNHLQYAHVKTVCNTI